MSDPNRSAPRMRSSAPALVAVSAFLLFGLNNTETAAFPQFVLSLGGSPLLAGLQNSIFVLLAIILRTLLEPAIRKHGSRFALVLGALGYVLPCLALGLCSELWQVIALRIAQALGLAAFQPSVSLYLAATSPPAVLGRRIGLVRFATTASLMIGPPVLFPLIDALGYDAFFIALGSAGIIGLIMAASLPYAADGVSIRRKRVDRDASDKSNPLTSNSDRVSLGNLNAVRKRRIMLVCGPFFIAIGYSIAMSFGQLLSSSSFSDGAGTVLSFLGIGGLAGSLVAGWATDRIKGKRIVACCLTANGIGLLAMALGPNMAFMLAGSLLCGGGYFGAIASLITAAGTSDNPRDASSLIARQQSGLDAGMVAGSACAGIMLQASASVDTVFLYAALSVLACIPVWCMVYPTEKEKH